MKQKYNFLLITIIGSLSLSGCAIFSIDTSGSKPTTSNEASQYDPNDPLQVSQDVFNKYLSGEGYLSKDFDIRSYSCIDLGSGSYADLYYTVFENRNGEYYYQESHDERSSSIRNYHTEVLIPNTSSNDYIQYTSVGFDDGKEGWYLTSESFVLTNEMLSRLFIYNLNYDMFHFTHFTDSQNHYELNESFKTKVTFNGKEMDVSFSDIYVNFENNKLKSIYAYLYINREGSVFTVDFFEPNQAKTYDEEFNINYHDCLLEFSSASRELDAESLSRLNNCYVTLLNDHTFQSRFNELDYNNTPQPVYFMGTYEKKIVEGTYGYEFTVTRKKPMSGETYDYATPVTYFLPYSYREEKNDYVLSYDTSILVSNEVKDVTITFAKTDKPIRYSEI